VKDGFFAEIPQLPAQPLQLRYESGSEWDAKGIIKEVNVTGHFLKNLHFYISSAYEKPGTINEITITPGLNEGFVSISAKEFFNKESI
jgi:hypothetical protein